MSVTTYATVNGRLVQENRGGVVTRCVAYTLGSVIQTRNAAGNQTSTTTYWPFGEVRTSSGTNPSPWGFCGTLGYFKDAVTRLYVRARVLKANLSRWLTVDLLWPSEEVYSYVLAQPTLYADPSGLWTPKPGKDILDCAKKLFGQKCTYTEPGGLACVEVFSICAGIKPKDIPQPCNHRRPTSDCPRSTDDVCNLLKKSGLYHPTPWQPKGKPCKGGDAICFGMSDYRPNAPCGGHCGIVSQVDSKGRPTHVIMCSEQCNPPNTVCEVEIHSWLDECRKHHGNCWVNGCGDAK